MKSLTESEKGSPCPYLSQIKPWNGRETFVEYLTNHYALMAMNPATIEQARLRTKELKGDFPTLGILIAAKIKEFRNEMPPLPGSD